MKTLQSTPINGCVDLAPPSTRGANACEALETASADCSKTLALVVAASHLGRAALAQA
jgi:hypothetical protein